MARRGSAIAGNRAVAVAPSTGPALPPGSVPSPLAQSLASGMGVNGGAKVDQTGSWGNLYGGTGLPRPSIDFTDGAFGPFSPIVPVPVNPAEPDTGLPLARREEYRVGWNLPVGQPGSEGLKLADFGTLRTLADLYSVARACIQFLKSQISSLEWDVAPTSEAAKAMRNDKGAMKDFGERRGQAVKFFRRPDPDYFNWQSWMSAAMEEVLVFDALSIVLRPKWGRGLKKGLLWSDLDSLNLISGPTVRPLYDMNGATPRPPAPAYQQYLYGVPRVDLMTMIRERDLDEGRLRESALGRYTNSQLLYLPTVPRRWTPYGFPPVERALIPVLAGLSKQGYQLDYFKEGTVPAVYISPGGDLTPNQIRELQDALNAIAGDPAWHHKILVLPSGSHTEPQRPTPLADTFDEIVMTQVCSAFGVQPMQIGISPRATGGLTSPAMANNMAKASSNTQDMSTLQPTLLFLTGIMDTILQDVCGQDDMRFVFAGMQEEEDEETTTNLLVNQVSHALITIDEARDKLGLQPYGITESTEPGFLTPTGFMFLSQPAAPVLPGGDGGSGNDGSTGGDAGGNPTPQKPTPPQYGPRPNGPANSTQGRPQQAPDKEPGETIPANSAAEGAAHAKAKPDQGGVTKAATGAQEPEQTPPPADQPTLGAEAARVALEAVIAQQVAGIVTDAWRGTTTLLGAVEQITGALAKAYFTVMKAASRAAAHAMPGVTQLADDVLHGLAQQRAAQQRAFSLHMVQLAVNTQTSAPPAWIPARSKLYAETLASAGHAAYGKTVEASEPDATIIWRLGETEHCPLCLARDGQEFTFDTLPGYPGDGGFGGPVCEGGPNCFPGYTEVQSADIELGFRRWYDGDVITVVTANGHELTGTPNHPVLTCAGWKPLGSLQDGDHLVGGSLGESGSVDPHVHAVPTAIEKVVESLHGLGPVGSGLGTDRVAVGDNDFHGDGAGSSEVEIVRPYGELTPYGNTASGKPVRHFLLSGANVGETALASLSHADSFNLSAGSPLSGGMGSGNLSGTLLRSQTLPLTSGGIRAGDGVGGTRSAGEALTTLKRRPCVAELSGVSGATNWNSVLTHDGLDEIGGTPDGTPDGLGTLPLHVALDKVVRVERRSFAGHVYNLQTVSGWYIANGIISHNCGCHLEYREGDRVLDTLGNMQRPESVGYYAQQNRDIQARRAQMRAERDDFVAGLPNTPGSDGTSAQMRAMARDDMRRQLASLANARIRSTGGYGGVSVEPEDIPAKLIASLIPQYGPIPADVPLTDVMSAVESMFAGKFAAADVTKTAFSSLLLSVVGDAMAGWERAAVAELEACARHLDKGRDATSWQPRKISPEQVATLADLLKAGATRADAVALTRRSVDNAGQVTLPEDEGPEPSHPVQEQTEDNPAGGGGYVLLPHDAQGIYRDLSDLRPLDARAQGKTYAEIGRDAVRRALKAAADPGDPNPVEAEHVYNQMLANYPPKAIQWVKKTRWIGPMAVDPQRADTADEDSWAASHEPARVAHFARKYKKGKDVKPGITVQEPGQSTVKIIDGHHRYLGARKAGKPYLAYVGFVDKDGGPWDETHSFQIHQGASPANKTIMTGKSAETAELSTVHHPLGTHGLWGDKLAQLPAYIQNIAHAMIRDGHDESEAIQLAIGAVKRWAEGGGKVTPEVRAAAAAAVAEWEKLKAEHNKTKALDPTGETALKVGPHGYIHGWIFVGVPGLGDAVSHPSHGKGVIEGHDDKHVTVRFQNGKTHTFDVHRDASEEGHFTERGKLEHPIKAGDPEHLADKVWNDPKEVENLTDDQLAAVREELLKRHEKIGVWGDEADRMDEVRATAQREESDRRMARTLTPHWSQNAGSLKYQDVKTLQLVKRDTERRAREQGISNPDLVEGHRQARVELNRRADKDPATWSVDRLHIHGGTPEQQVRAAEAVKKITADIPPKQGARLAHVQIKDQDKPETQGSYWWKTNHMELSPKLFNTAPMNGQSTKDLEDMGWYSKSGHTDQLERTIDHEFGHHLDSQFMASWESMKKRDDMFRHLSGVLGMSKMRKNQDIKTHYDRAKAFVSRSKGDIVNLVGTYASTDPHELVAELWTEYHGKKLRGVPDSDQFKSSQIVGRYLVGHDTPFDPEKP